MHILEYLQKFIGRPYIWGGNGTGKSDFGFDCSGLVVEGLTAFGRISSDMTSQMLYNWAVKEKSQNELTLLFFGKSTQSITHIAIKINGVLMLEAGGGGSACKSQESSTGFVRIRPIKSRKDLVAEITV